MTTNQRQLTHQTSPIENPRLSILQDIHALQKALQLKNQVIDDFSGMLMPRLNRLNQLEMEVIEAEKHLVVLLLGGSGVGKSTLLNAIAGAQIAKSSNDIRGYTQQLNVYHHEKVSLKQLPIPLPFEHYAHQEKSLEHLIIVDAPDIDTVNEANQALVERFLPMVDLAIYVSSYQKYRNHHIHDFIKRIKGAHAFIFLMNQMDFIQSQKNYDILMTDFKELLEQAGFRKPTILSISAKEVLAFTQNQKQGLNLQVDSSFYDYDSADEFKRLNQKYVDDFAELMRIFKEEIQKEEILRIKKRGMIGRLKKIIQDLKDDLNEQDVQDLIALLNQQIYALQTNFNQLESQLLEKLENIQAQFDTEFQKYIHLQRDHASLGIYGWFLKTKKYGLVRTILMSIDQPKDLTTQISEVSNDGIQWDDRQLKSDQKSILLAIAQNANQQLEQIKSILHAKFPLCPQFEAKFNPKSIDWDELWLKDFDSQVRSYTKTKLPPRQTWEVNFLPFLSTILMFVLLIKRWISGAEIGLFSLIITTSVVYLTCQAQYLWFAKKDMALYQAQSLEKKSARSSVFLETLREKYQSIIQSLEKFKKQLEQIDQIDQKLYKTALEEDRFFGS
jgi:small GTP-binding protein